MMQLRNLIRLYGALDIGLIAWMILVAIRAGKIPFYNDFSDATVAANAFGHPAAQALIVVSFLLMGTLFFSGILLLRLKTIGGYIALFQAPFRLFLVLKPTFFFLMWLNGQQELFWLSVALIGILEVAKTISLVVWVRQKPIESKVSELG